MIKRASVLASALSCTLLMGCATVAHGPVTAPLVFDMKGPVSLGPATGSAKVGRAEAWGILVFATGDASVAAAMRNGGIKRAHHIDNETMNILGIYAKYTTIVYGE